MKRRQKKQRRAQAAARYRGQRQTTRRPIARQRAQAATAQASAAELGSLDGLQCCGGERDPGERDGLTVADLGARPTQDCSLCG